MLYYIIATLSRSNTTLPTKQFTYSYLTWNLRAPVVTTTVTHVKLLTCLAFMAYIQKTHNLAQWLTWVLTTLMHITYPTRIYIQKLRKFDSVIAFRQDNLTNLTTHHQWALKPACDVTNSSSRCFCYFLSFLLLYIHKIKFPHGHVFLDEHAPFLPWVIIQASR